MIKTIDPRDDFVVVNRTTGKAVETQSTVERARHAVEVLNQHEIECGRSINYYWIESRLLPKDKWE